MNTASKEGQVQGQRSFLTTLRRSFGKLLRFLGRLYVVIGDVLVEQRKSKQANDTVSGTGVGM